MSEDFRKDVQDGWQGQTETMTRLLPVVAVAVALLSPGRCQERTATHVTVTDHGSSVYDPPDNRVVHTREIAFTSGQTSYSLSFAETHIKDDAGKETIQGATVGIECRTGGKGQGWYPGDTFRVLADGMDLHRASSNWSSIRTLSQGEKGLVEAVLDHPKATVVIRFALLPGQEEIDCLIHLQPKAAVESMEVRMSCYPAFFTAWNKRRGDRWAATPVRSIEEPREPDLNMDAKEWKHVVQQTDLDPPKEWWVFYYDKHFNSPAGKGSGVCGLVVNAVELARSRLEVSDYEIGTTLIARSCSSPLHFSLWQRNVQDYEAPLKEFSSIAEDTNKRLSDRHLFSPSSLVAFDAAAELKSLQELEEAKINTGELRRMLEATTQRVKARGASPPESWLTTEAAALSAIADYRRALWKSRRQLPHGLRILALEGAHFQEWKLTEAAALLSPAAAVDTSHFSVSWQGDRLTSFPATEEEMMQYDSVALINVSAVPLREQGQKLLKWFVANGGGLIVFGGFYAFGGGEYAGTALEELLPVVVNGPFDVLRLSSPSPIVNGDKVGDLKPPVWKAPAMVMWLQYLPPKPGAIVPLKVRTAQGDKPFLVLGRFGQGKVAALAGTVYGNPPAGKTEFWNCPEWPAYLASVVRWVCGR
ncbi:MAG: hypothetical protein AUJ92_03985 [Armatimonadetes bacterium CG2_30_59_28]|nr:MAG: hypothetical protein AUJ92_03985 [Armatimonadetes bacterium CG2_30_59_28]